MSIVGKMRDNSCVVVRNGEWLVGVLVEMKRER